MVIASRVSATEKIAGRQRDLLARQAVGVARRRPSARGGRARSGRRPSRNGTCRTISQPITGWLRISRLSSSPSGSGLCRIPSGIATLPTSCSRKPNSVWGSSASSGSIRRASSQAVGGHALGVLAGVGVAGLDGVGQRAHGGHVGVAQLLRAGALGLEGLAQVGGVALELTLLLLGGCRAARPARPCRRSISALSSSCPITVPLASVSGQGVRRSVDGSG